MPEKRYTAGDASGWLVVKREPSGQRVPLPQHLQVSLEASRGGRDYFTASEGVERGNAFSVISGNLRTTSPGYRAPAQLQFSLSKQQLGYAGRTAKAITEESNPIPIGTHPIQIPDFPHDLGADYLDRSRYAKSWFFLGQGHAVSGNRGRDRYLHTGGRSAGCITVNPADWTALYEYLILCRRGDDKTVGSVVVVR